MRALALLLLSPGLAAAATATLTWTLPTTRTDGTALPASGIQGFEIDYALCAAGNVFPATPAGTQTVAGAVTMASVTVPTYGTWCFRARTVDTGGQESANTGTVYRAYVAPPNPPGGLAVTNIVAYDTTIDRRGNVKLGRMVGTVPLGTACGTVYVQKRGASYADVPRETVTLTRQPRSALIVAQCKAA